MPIEAPLLNTPRLVRAGQSHGLWSGESLKQWTHSLAQSSGRPQRDWVSQAGHQLARLSMALHPHAQRIWVCCGPGANGLDGWHAACALKAMGKTVLISATHSPPDELKAMAAHCITTLPQDWDLAIDALYGIGLSRRITAEDQVSAWLSHLHHASGPMLHADVPSGLCPSTGTWLGPEVPFGLGPRYTLAMLGMSMGLWTHQGRDVAGQVWLSESSLPCPTRADAELVHATQLPPRAHDSHKGRNGHVIVVGGQEGMQGAALLAARSALTHGAGVVHWHAPYQARFSPDLDARPDRAPLDLTTLPIQILREWPTQLQARDVVVAGCGAGEVDESFWHTVFARAPQLVLDADGLNALARHERLAQVVSRRGQRHQPTVITPHPLEAARLLSCRTEDIQANRAEAAKRLSQHLQCITVLKGSGTVIASARGDCWINPTGNARLATAGSGDVLAGFIGALLAQGLTAELAAQHAVFEMGCMADQIATASSSTHRAWTADQQALMRS